MSTTIPAIKNTSTRTMRAVRFHRPGEVRVDSVPIPELLPGDVLIRVAAVGICTTDRKIAARGHFKIPAGVGPRTLGHEVVGEVASVGDSPGEPGPVYGPGTRVAVAPNICRDQSDACVSADSHLSPENEPLGISLDGGMAEYMRVPAAAVEKGHLLPLPDGVPFDVAVLLEPLSCCYNSLESCSMKPGESLLVIGGGAMGQLHVSLARAFGVGLLVVSDPNPSRLQRVRELGAHATVNVREEDLARRTDELTAGRGFDVIAVAAGSAAAQSEAIGLAATRGRINLFASLAGDQEMPRIDANRIHYKQIQLLGTTGASIVQMRRTLRLIANGAIDPSSMVTARYGLDEAERAFEAAGSKEHARVILEP